MDGYIDLVVDEVVGKITGALYQFIEEIAAAFKKQIETVTNPLRNDPVRYPDDMAYLAAIRDDIIAVATVIHKHFPDYDIDRFYQEAGYTGTHPVHGSSTNSNKAWNQQKPTETKRTLHRPGV